MEALPLPPALLPHRSGAARSALTCRTADPLAPRRTLAAGDAGRPHGAVEPLLPPEKQLPVPRAAPPGSRAGDSDWPTLREAAPSALLPAFLALPPVTWPSAAQPVADRGTPARCCAAALAAAGGGVPPTEGGTRECCAEGACSGFRLPAARPQERLGTAGVYCGFAQLAAQPPAWQGAGGACWRFVPPATQAPAGQRTDAACWVFTAPAAQLLGGQGAGGVRWRWGTTPAATEPPAELGAGDARWGTAPAAAQAPAGQGAGGGRCGAALAAVHPLPQLGVACSVVLKDPQALMDGVTVAEQGGGGRASPAGRAAGTAVTTVGPRAAGRKGSAESPIPAIGAPPGFAEGSRGTSLEPAIAAPLEPARARAGGWLAHRVAARVRMWPRPHRKLSN